MPTKSLELNHTIKLIQKLTSEIDKIENEYVCHSNPTFTECLSQKRAEGKHYNVAISHAVKKLVQFIYHLEKTNQLKSI